MAEMNEALAVRLSVPCGSRSHPRPELRRRFVSVLTLTPPRPSSLSSSIRHRNAACTQCPRVLGYILKVPAVTSCQPIGSWMAIRMVSGNLLVYMLVSGGLCYSTNCVQGRHNPCSIFDLLNNPTVRYTLL